MNMKDNRILCTFTNEDDLGVTVETIKHRYLIPQKRIFVLEAKDNGLLVTYNTNISNIKEFPKDTILVHRRRESNTLYTVNALNILIRTLNGGELDKNYVIDWDRFGSTLLLTRDGILYVLHTKLRNIVEL